MAKHEKKSRKQTNLESWRKKAPEVKSQNVSAATSYNYKQDTDCALKQIFGHKSYKSDVQRKAVSAILTGLKFRLCNTIQL